MVVKWCCGGVKVVQWCYCGDFVEIVIRWK